MTDRLPPPPVDGHDSAAALTPTAARRIGHAARGRLGAAARRERSDAVVATLLDLPELAGPGAVATYASTGDELDPSAAEGPLRDRGFAVHLPRIGEDADTTPRMDFVPWEAGAPLHLNRFGIAEPAGDPVDPAGLDVVVLPAVAVDLLGTRVGFGAGYYDRALAGFRERDGSRAPLLVGLAFEAQVVEVVTPQEWDVPLDALVTESGVRRFGSAGRRGPAPGPDEDAGAPAR